MLSSLGSETTEGATGGGGALQAARQITSAPPGVDKLAGPELLQHIRNVHPRHEAMVQTSLQRETIPTNLLEHVRLIQRAAVEAPAAPVVDAPVATPKPVGK